MQTQDYDNVKKPIAHLHPSNDLPRLTLALISREEKLDTNFIKDHFRHAHKEKQQKKIHVKLDN